MSDYLVRFIPENIDAILSREEISLVEELDWDGSIPKILFNERILFADAGQNFETVLCPICKTNLTEWWGSAMCDAYSEDYGFTKLEITTPCCKKTTSLHSLDYNFPQGFYKTMIEVVPKTDGKAKLESIVDKLSDMTNVNWRIVHVHY